MAHHNTVFSQILKLVPRHEFESLARAHHQGRKLRKMTRWSQFVSLGLAQLAGRTSLRDVVSNLKVQAGKLYHLGCGTVNRSSLARVNREQPHSLYEALFGKLLARCHDYRNLQRTLADRIVLQMDQAEPEDQILSGHVAQRSDDPNLGRDVYVSTACLYPVYEQARPGNATDPAPAATQFI